MVGNSKIWKFGGKFSEIEKYENSVENFRKYTFLTDSHYIHKLIIDNQSFKLEISKNYIKLMIYQMSHRCDMKDCESQFVLHAIFRKFAGIFLGRDFAT